MAEVHPEIASEVESSRSVATVVWGLLLIWTGVVVFLHWGWGVGALGAGAILIGAQLVRSSRRLAVDRFGVVAGALLVISGAGSLFEVAIDLFPLLIIAAGIALLVSSWTARARHGTGAGPELRAPSHPRP